MPVVVRCHQCLAERRFEEESMLARLHSRGMLRRERNPETALVRELFTTLAEDLPCPECGASGATVHDLWDDEWSDEAPCEGCKTPISAERLEIFPDTKLCPSCQSKLDAGEDIHQEVDYCPSCGGILQLSKRHGTGLAGYRMVCGECGKRA